MGTTRERSPLVLFGLNRRRGELFFAGDHHEEMAAIWGKFEPFLFKKDQGAPRMKPLEATTVKGYARSYVNAFNRTPKWVKQGMDIDTRAGIVEALEDVEQFIEENRHAGYSNEIPVMKRFQRFLEVDALAAVERKEARAKKEVQAAKVATEERGREIPRTVTAIHEAGCSSTSSSSDDDGDGEDLQERIRELEKDRDKYKGKRDKAKKARDRARQERDQYKAELEELKGEKEGLERKVAEIEQDKQNLEEKLTGKVAKKKALIAGLKEKLRASEEQNAQTQLELEQAQGKEASTVVPPLPPNMQEMQDKYEDELAKLHKKIVRLYDEKKELQMRLTKATIKTEDKPPEIVLEHQQSSSSSSNAPTTTNREDQPTAGGGRKRSRGSSMDDNSNHQDRHTRARVEESYKAGSSNDVQGAQDVHGGVDVYPSQQPPFIVGSSLSQGRNSPNSSRPSRWGQLPTGVQDASATTATMYP